MTNLPTVTPLRGTPEELVAYAAGATRGRETLREWPREQKTIASLVREDPPHLTCVEHARFVFKADSALATGPVYDLLRNGRGTVLYLPAVDFDVGAGGWRRLGRGDTFSVNASHLFALRRTPFGRVLIEKTRPLLPTVLAGIPVDEEEHVWDWQTELARDDELEDDERALFPSRTFAVVCSRVCSHEFVTHRTISRDQESQRAVKDPMHRGCIWPPASIGDGVALRNAVGSAEFYSEICFEQLVDKMGWRRQDARYGVIGAAATRLVATAPLGKDVRQGNHLGWYHFLRLRGAPGALHEIRFVAWLLHRELVAEFPDMFGDLTIDTTEIEGWIEMARGAPA